MCRRDEYIAEAMLRDNVSDLQHDPSDILAKLQKKDGFHPDTLTSKCLILEKFLKKQQISSIQSSDKITASLPDHTFLQFV